MSGKSLTEQREAGKDIKCLVWDLDNTLWHGVLLEGDAVYIDELTVHIIETLDSRGILQSVASRNDPKAAMDKVCQFGLENYFLYPQINWGSKASSIKAIAESINIGRDAIAFIDDQEYERAEVSYSLPEVLCIDAAQLPRLLDMPEMNPRFITSDSRLRRQMYLSDLSRKTVEESFEGPQESFLASLDMVLSIFPAQARDLQRAEELTVRTHQLNATGYTYSYEELAHFSQSDDHLLLMARLEDRFGTYGHIGLALIERQPRTWTLKLLLMSCRVMSRGVGSILLNHILNLAREAGARLTAEYVPTERNRMMEVTYHFAGFHEISRVGNLVTLEHDLQDIPACPDYVRVVLGDAATQAVF